MITFDRKVWEVYRPHEPSDVHIGFFAWKDDAVEAVRRSGPGIYPREKDLFIKVYENYTEYQEEVDRVIRKAALAKLNSEEKRVLGVKD